MSETVYESVKGPSKIINKIRKMKIPTEKFEERLLAMDMTAEQFVDYIGHEPDVFLGNVANVKKDIIHSCKLKTDESYRIELKIKELKKLIDDEPKSLEYRVDTPSLSAFKIHMKLIKMKYNFYLRYLKYCKDDDNQILYDKCKEMYDKIVETVVKLGPKWYEIVFDDISIFIPIHWTDFME